LISKKVLKQTPSGFPFVERSERVETCVTFVRE
jgi:hypothetical protein